MTPERQKRIEQVLSKRQTDITIVLENIFDPHNISAVMRTCDSVGINEIYVLNTKLPLHKKWGKRSSSSAAKWLTIHQFENARECFQQIRLKYDFIYSTLLQADSKQLYELDLTKKTALIFGNEHSGVSEEINQYSDGNFIIPQVGMIKSLNISVACAVTLYEAFRQKMISGHYDQPKLNDADYLIIKEKWMKNED